MDLALSTHWNASRHATGEAMIEEILALGLDRVELGYDLRMDLVPGVRNMVASGAVRVGSVHNFCPVPVGAPQGHPELFLLSDTNRRTRENAVTYTLRSVELAAEMGARTVVVHGGRVDMRHLTPKLISLCHKGRRNSRSYERTWDKLLTRREKRAPKHVDLLCASIEELLPSLQSANVAIALENLPSWEAIPSEVEMERIAERFNSPLVRFWYDTGHGFIRDNLGFACSLRWLQRLRGCLAGMHLHDCIPPDRDHLMPPEGRIDFRLLKDCVEPATLLVLEPAPWTPVERVVEGLRILKTALG